MPGPPRKFDWDEAARMRERGMSYAAIGRNLGVSATAVVRALDPSFRAKMAETSKRLTMSGVCEECGKQGVTSAAHRAAPSLATTRPAVRVLCKACSGKERWTRVRFDDSGALVAVRCCSSDCANGDPWQTPDVFPRGKGLRDVREGGINQQCRACGTRARRDYRSRHREAENAYLREYRRRKKAA